MVLLVPLHEGELMLELGRGKATESLLTSFLGQERRILH